ncbi:hypothetical protein CcaverHIS002_0300590 [Cutaneotrichosporon cavernicola]|uniref:FAD dependent oxidoreductase domain-containing protein n=1 Tax=Cutaneotrichosporon cavernicola TaxID=279322 RepID=A0AA48KZ21_9TREE|nr:uncharacterized protein CcaverHIS019_0300590 [Cutaneotrichosporon cavernicola]BEI82191.1 hypothetical protein CcaverHIS002_0300590 [Cutaneotrichosporon cavernicola]BEI89989.1 hypothetical protein CcaverHIS019_0300590 [Cutaneotrichosporon cavernicola]BEI97761.1 hypothetical protein CcaverHIS631_0300600 [Cutaneotrichosporon cavernicola]BEJ05539.1 hypothetical protein CcaverHIS641_0300610 [Cutaneotrichosporon cavernicola]
MIEPPPGLPVPLANLSLWQRTVSSHPLLNARQHEPLPASADIVVIGGGLCGAVVAHALLFPDEHPTPEAGATQTPESAPVGSVVMLEARALASGASGRNAGHCRPDAGRGFPGYAKIHGEEEAVHILRSEAVALQRTGAFILKNGIECEWTERDTYDVHLSASFAEHSAKALEAYVAAGGTPATHLSAETETRMGCVGATKWRAATLNPAQLTLGVIGLCESDSRFKAFSHAPVWHVSKEGDGWMVDGPRGQVRANKVVWATNAYRGCAGLEGYVQPQGAQAHKLSRAPAGRDVFPDLEGSYSLRQSTEVFYSVAPRPDGSIVLGASRGSWPAPLLAANFGCTNDAGWHAAVASNAFRSWVDMYPSGGWVAGEQKDMEAAARVPGTQDRPDDNGTVGLEYAWNGIIGVTQDNVPLVGEVGGEYVAVGYCGHGMARMFVTGPALAHYIRTGAWDRAMPKSFRVTPERLARLRA